MKAVAGSIWPGSRAGVKGQPTHHAPYFHRAARVVPGLLAVLLWIAGSLSAAQGALSLLRCRGTDIVDADGAVIHLNGVNLGGWFIMEKWMCPLDSGNLPDTYSVIQELDSRFGVATEQSLIRTYQTNWITTTDLDNIRNGGYNCVRVPVWWGNFYSLTNVSNSGWRSDAFAVLDWLVTNCAARDIYVVIDMHGVVGGQSLSDTTGQANQNQYWTDGNDQGNTAWMWWQIANHYRGNPAVAGYDLINEPYGSPSNAAIWSAYDSLYGTIRSADPEHIIIMEGTFGSWNWSMLPPPSSYGWTNIVYSMHEYQWNGTVAQIEAGADNQVADFNNHKSWNVPDYISEFNNFDSGVDCWSYSVNAYNSAGISWSMWAYKAASGLLPNAWGWYDPTHWPPTPNISTDSASTISNDWRQWRTAAAFGLNTAISFPPSTNLPAITGVYPDGTTFFQFTNVLTFVVSSPAGIATNSVGLVLDGVNRSGALEFSGASSNWTVRYLNLPFNTNHTAVISVTNLNGASTSAAVTFDTFQDGAYTWEAEDYDYGGGHYFDNPQVDAYANLPAAAGVDYSDVNFGGTYLYRPGGTATEITADTPRPQFAGAYDYNIGYFSTGEWGNYTRHYPAGTFNVWGRFAAGGGDTQAYLDRVTGGWGTSSQTTDFLGTFFIPTSTWSHFIWVPLTDNGGTLVKLTLTGPTNTLRLARPDPSTGLPDVNVNFLMLVPLDGPVTLRAGVSDGSVSLSFPTQAGLSYQVQYKDNLGDAGWLPLGLPVAGDNTVQTIGNPTGANSRYYRLQIQY
jgi:endoglucanase